MKHQAILSRLRQRLFDWLINREIFLKILPHRNREADHGYPFTTDAEMARRRAEENRNLQAASNRLEQLIQQMPKAYGEAFSYIVCRDLRRQLESYVAVAERRVQPETYDPREVARRAKQPA